MSCDCCTCDCRRARAREERRRHQREIEEVLRARGATWSRKRGTGVGLKATAHWHHPNWFTTLAVSGYGIRPCIDQAKRVLPYEDLTPERLELAIQLCVCPLPEEEDSAWWTRYAKPAPVKQLREAAPAPEAAPTVPHPDATPAKGPHGTVKTPPKADRRKAAKPSPSPSPEVPLTTRVKAIEKKLSVPRKMKWLRDQVIPERAGKGTHQNKLLKDALVEVYGDRLEIRGKGGHRPAHGNADSAQGRAIYLEICSIATRPAPSETRIFLLISATSTAVSVQPEGVLGHALWGPIGLSRA